MSARVWMLLSSCSLVLAELQRTFGCLLVPFQKLRFGRGVPRGILMGGASGETHSSSGVLNKWWSICSRQDRPGGGYKEPTSNLEWAGGKALWVYCSTKL